MHEVIQRYFSELRSAWRFRWWGALLAWLVFVGGLGWVAWQPDIYEANAQVYVDTSSVLRPVLNDQIVQPDIGTELQYVRQALLGREHLERVARQANLDVNATSPAELEGVLTGLRSNIELTSGGSSRNAPENIYDIRYRHSDRDTSVTVVQTLLDTFVETTLGANREGSATAGRFLDERIAEYEQRLQEAEQALADFKKRNADRLPGAEGGYFDEIRRQQDALEEAEKALRVAESRRERLLEQLDSETPVLPFTGENAEPPPGSLEARIRDYERELDQLLLQYTERHPDVVAVRESLERLRAQRAEQLEQLEGDGQRLPEAGNNPVYQAARIALNEVEAEIAALEEDVADRRSELEELRALVDEVPEVEAELARLNRDYEIVYEQYQSLIRSRETQDLTRKASDADQVEFRVIEPPLASFEPVAPNRLQLLGMVLIGSIGAGGGLCWLLAQLRPVFSSAAALRETVGLPVLGAVSEAWQSRHQLRRRMALAGFVGVMSGLLVLFAGAVWIELFGPGLRSLAGLL